jgi:hypothetical protein
MTSNRGEVAQSLLPLHIPRLAKDAIIVIRVTPINSTLADPYYVSATYDQGSVQYPNYDIRDVEKGRFPDIRAGRGDIYGQVLIISSSFSFVFFFIAIAHKRIKEIAQKGMHNNLLWVIPAAILLSFFLLYVCEELPRSLLITAGILIPPLDVRIGLSTSYIISGPIQYNQGTLIAGAFAFCAFFWFARWILGYIIAKVIIIKSHVSMSILQNIDPRPLNVEPSDRKFEVILSKKKFRLISLLLIGTPVESFIILFFGQSVYNFSASSIFMIFLTIDIIRTLILILIAPKITHVNRKILHYGLLGVSMTGVIIHLALFIILVRNFMTSYYNEIIYSATKYGVFYNVLIFAGIISVVELIRLVVIAHILNNYVEAYPNKFKHLHLPAFGLSLILIISWIYILAYVTSIQHPILQIIPIVLIGIISIVLEFSYLVLTIIIIKKPANLQQPKNTSTPS